MARIQQCNKNCGKLIVVQMDPTIGKYVPFEVDLGGNPTNKHNCPNSQYNKQQQGGGQVTTQQISQPAPAQGIDFSKLINKPQEPQAIDRPSLEATLLNQTSQKAEQALKQLEAIKYFSESILSTKIEQCFELAKNSNMMLEALVAHFQLTKPKSAAELYKQEHPDEKLTEQEEKLLEQEGI